MIASEPLAAVRLSLSAPAAEAFRSGRSLEGRYSVGANVLGAFYGVCGLGLTAVLIFPLAARFDAPLNGGASRTLIAIACLFSCGMLFLIDRSLRKAWDRSVQLIISRECLHDLRQPFGRFLWHEVHHMRLLQRADELKPALLINVHRPTNTPGLHIDLSGFDAEPEDIFAFAVAAREAWGLPMERPRDSGEAVVTIEVQKTEWPVDKVAAADHDAVSTEQCRLE